MIHIDKKLTEDNDIITDLALCRVILVNNALFPWLILVPLKDKVSEIIDLTSADRHILTDEISYIASLMKNLFHADKLNIAALGNMVPQLHIHIIARYKNDKAWPHPVWGKGLEQKYDNVEKKQLIETLRKNINYV